MDILASEKANINIIFQTPRWIILVCFKLGEISFINLYQLLYFVNIINSSIRKVQALVARRCTMGTCSVLC